MKAFLALAVLATSVSAVAASREIQDLMYLPNAGTVYGFSDFNYVDIKIGGDDFTNDSDGFALTQTVGYAPTDRLSVQGTLGYTKSDSESKSGGTSEDSEAKGIRDPNVQVKFRAMDEDFRLDLIGGAIISLGDSEIDDDGDSNYYQGGHSLFAGAQIGKKTDYSQWAILAQLQHNMKSTTDEDSAGKVKDDAHNQLTLEASLLTKIAESNYIRTSATALMIEEFEDDNDATYTASTSQTFGAEYRYLFSKDVMLKVGASHGFVSTFKRGRFQNTTYLAGLNYQF